MTEVVNMLQVRMIERRHNASFLLKALDLLLVVSESRQEDLEGDPPSEPRVLGQIHLTHAARAELRLDLVGA